MNFTSRATIRMPPLVPINHYFNSETNSKEPKSFSIIPCKNIQAKRLCWALWFNQSNSREHKKTPTNYTSESSITQRWTVSQGTDPTTSFLTTARQIYTLRAGITAAAGTRLALSLIIVNGFNLDPFRWLKPKVWVSLLVVTTSSNWEWVIYAPAAFLGCSCRL